MSDVWISVEGPASGNGTYTDYLKVPGGRLYRVEEWGTGGMEGKLLHRCLAFVPDPPKKERRIT